MSIRQQSALFIQRESFRSFYTGIFSSEEIWKLLSEHCLEYGTNIDVTLFTAEKRRQTFNDNLVQAAMESQNGVNAGGSGGMGKRKGKKRKKGGDPGTGQVLIWLILGPGLLCARVPHVFVTVTASRARTRCWLFLFSPCPAVRPDKLY